jgi:AcrR family transcriptional regulator
MDTTPSRKQASHDRILEMAARTVRSDGFGGVRVADIMQKAGLTHGGFYAHFASRDALLAEALERAGRDSAERLLRGIAAGQARGASRFRALVENYLADRQLKSSEAGCPVAALGSEMPRLADGVRDAATRRVTALIAAVRDALPADAPDETAGVVAAQLVGALQLARTLGDNARGRRQLAAARDFLLAQFDTPQPRR